MCVELAVKMLSRLFRNLKSEEKYRDILVGLDISGDPRVSDLSEVLGKITELRNKEGLKFAIHLAEVPNHDETSAVLATNPDRIGKMTESVTSVSLLLNILLRARDLYSPFSGGI